MQNKYIKYIASLSTSLLLAVLGLSMLLNSCKKDETNSTVALYSFGPMPIARGAVLEFIGKNLDQVSAVVLPGNEQITTFVTKTSSLLTISVPQDATSGSIVLKTAQGDITTKTPIGYSEPISIDSIPSASIKPGDVLTFTGDYLNLVKSVIFANNVVDSVFVSSSRKMLKIVVPAQAQTGKIALSDGKKTPSLVYSATALKVTLPAFTSVVPNPVKAGNALTITGTNLDLVKAVVLGAGNKTVLSAAFTTQTATQIILNVPVDTQDGSVTMVQASGVNVVSATPLVMVIPTVSVSPTTIKNGNDITVTGTDLDLVDKVIFSNNVQGVVKTGGTSTQIIVTVPDKAVSGTVQFVTKALKTVNGPSLTIIDPTITSFAPTSSKAKSDITLTGTDLDLVTDVTFDGGVKGVIGTNTGTQLTVTVPVGAKTGTFTLTTKNGSTITSPAGLTILANLPNFSSYTENKATPNAILTLNGTSMSLIKEIIFPGNVVATDYGSKSDTKVEVYVPYASARGMGQISIVTYEGEQGLLPSIYVGGTDPVVDQTYCFFDFNGTGKDSWWGNAIGSGILNDPASSSDGTPYWNVNGMGSTSWWDGLFWRNGGNNFKTTGVDVATWAVRFDINVREAIAANSGYLKIRFGDFYYIFNPWDKAGSYMTVGWITVTCPLTGFYNNSIQMTSVPTTGDFGMVWSSGTSVKVDMGIDNIRFEKIP